MNILYDEYKLAQKEYSEKWEFADKILYDMCRCNPTHDDNSVIAGKMLLIGRSYAAAVERRKEYTDFTNDEFYFDKVVDSIRNCDLDRELVTIKGTIEKKTEKILSLHYKVTKELLDITGEHKRSLVSKYLHFHAPEYFFIYDERAKTIVGELIKNDYEKIDINVESDLEYTTFIFRMMELRRRIADMGHIDEKEIAPRMLDNYLLWNYEKERLKKREMRI